MLMTWNALDDTSGLSIKKLPQRMQTRHSPNTHESLKV